MKKKQEPVQYKTRNQEENQAAQQQPVTPPTENKQDEQAMPAEKKHKHTSHIRKSGRHSRDNFGSYRGL